MRTGRRLSTLLAAALLTACLELSGPRSGVESLSRVRLPYPAALAGDTLRDSLGVARRLDVLAFSGRGDTVQLADEIRFVIPDTGTGARIENGFFIAGTRLGPVRVVAQTAGLQTPVDTIHVVPVPTLARAEPASLGNPATLAPRTYSAAAQSVTSDPLQVRVQGNVDGSPANVNGWIVSYRITRQPPSRLEGIAPAYLVDDRSRTLPADSTVAVDTTSSGLAARRVVLRPVALSEPVDTVVVEATVLLHGVHVAGSPVVFRVPFAPAP